MTTIICGEAGTGKSTLLYKMIEETAARGSRAVLFVPDQFSFEAEKMIYRTIPRGFRDKVRVSMFSREAQSVLRRFGENKEYADDVAKKILMTRAVKEAAENEGFLYYDRQAGKPQFSDFALSVVSELRSAGLSPSGLISLASRENSFSDTLTRKVNDICAFYSRYDELLTVSFSDRLDDIRRAAELIRESDIFGGVTCFFDGFDRFSGNQLNFIYALMGKAERCVFALTCSPDSDKDRRFLAANALIGKLKEKSDGEAEIIKLTERYRVCGEYHVTAAQDVWQECDWICAEIRRLTDGGMRYGDIAVLSPEESCSQVLRSAMKKYDIPAFIDIPEPLISKSFVKFPIYAVRALSFETEDILRYLKCGYVRLGERLIHSTEIDMLERLSRRYDLRRRDWLRKFPEKLDESGELEALRKGVIEPLTALRGDITGKDGAEMTHVLCDFIFEKMNMGRTIYGKCIIGNENGKNIVDRRKLDEFSSLLEDANTVFESLYKSLSGYYADSEEYLSILTDIFTSTTVAKPPQVLDAVTVGDTERSRFTGVKALFICGFMNGVIPRPKPFSGAFTGSEGEQLAACGIPIGSDRQTRFSEEAFIVYRCVNIPEEKLYMTYPLLNASFSPAEPSPYLTELIKAHGITVRGADEFGADFYCRTEAAAKRYFAGIYPDPVKANEREAAASRLPDDFTDMIKSAAESEKPECQRRLITPEHARELLSLEAYSPTALEKLNNCRFNFFCSYGLGIRPPEDRRIDPMLTGNVIHFCLCRLLSDYADKPDEFRALSPARIYRHVIKSVDIYERENYFGGFGGTERFSYMLRRLSGTAARAALRIQFEIKSGGFYPELLEQKLRFQFGNITVKGVCDRIDAITKDGEKYIRVVDYKHGSKNIALSDAYSGNNLQMLLYLFGASKALGAKPASVMYSLVGSPKNRSVNGVDTDSDASDSLKSYIKDHSMRGILLTSSPELLETERLNAELTDRYGRLAQGAPYIKAEQISEGDFSALERYCLAYVNAIVEESLHGMISSNCRDKNKCAYCDHTLICGRKAGDTNE